MSKNKETAKASNQDVQSTAALEVDITQDALVQSEETSGRVEIDKPAPEQEKSVNEEPRWTAIRQRWAKEQADLAEAHALSYFDIEDDLPLSRHLLLVSIFGFFLLFVVWANWAELDEVTRGEGKIIPSSEVQALQSLDAGTVEELLVQEGDIVEIGQVLVRLSDIEAASNLGANNARYYGLLASVLRLQAEAEGRDSLMFPEDLKKLTPLSVAEEMNGFRANKERLNGQLNTLKQQRNQKEQEVLELESRIVDTKEVLDLQTREMEIIKPLVERGSAPELELLQLERSVKEKAAELNGYEKSLPRSRAAVEEARARIEEAKMTARAQAQSELATKQLELNEIKERLSAFEERKTRTEIKSPVNGTVKELLVNTVGGVVRPGEDIVQIVPSDDQLLVEARVRPSDIAFLYSGQKAVVKITAYDFSIYGGLDAEVIDISADTIEDQHGNSFYRVRLRTYETELKRKGEVLPIIPGMVTSVDVLTGKKTVMQYLLKPFIKTIDGAMNER